MSRTKWPKVYRVVALTAAVLLALEILLPFSGLEPPLGKVTSVQNQRDPTACDAVGNSWTSCGRAFGHDSRSGDADGSTGGEGRV